MNHKLEIRNLTKTFNTEEGELKALDNVSIEVKPAEFLCIIGPGLWEDNIAQNDCGLGAPEQWRDYSGW